MAYSEWSTRNRFNSFNTMKIARYVDYWKNIEKFVNNETLKLVPPVSVTVDLSLACNLKCNFCNAKNVISNKNAMMSPEWMIALPRVLKEWGVKGVTVAGGGEPLCNPQCDLFFYACKDAGIPVGLITNGTLIHKHRQTILDCCKWVGVSVDAGTTETYGLIKNVDGGRLKDVIDNITSITRKGPEITYKYLVCPENYSEVYKAVGLAFAHYCDQIHIRPVGKAWFEDKTPVFDNGQVDSVLQQVSQARTDYECDRFKVFGITHKFGTDWGIHNDFEKCWSSLMYLVIQPNGKLITCCDRRGDDKVSIADSLEHPSEIPLVWGSKRHKHILEDIDVKKCARCTFSLHNQIYENMVVEDKTNSEFI